MKSSSEEHWQNTYLKIDWFGPIEVIKKTKITSGAWKFLAEIWNFSRHPINEDTPMLCIGELH